MEVHGQAVMHAGRKVNGNQAYGIMEVHGRARTYAKGKVNGSQGIRRNGNIRR